MTADFQFKSIGQPLRRKEDLRLITGLGQFTDDFSAEGQAHAVMVRSPHPHARIVRIDKAAALALPGVLAVLDGTDCIADGLRPIPHDPVPKTKFDMKLTAPNGSAVFIGPHALLPAHRVRHVGEAVAMVVAATRAQALDAAEQVAVEYEVLPHVLDVRDALAPNSASVWNDVAHNTCVDTWFGDRTATDKAFAAADLVIEREFHIARVTGVPLEPRSALGIFDAASGRYTLHAGSGGAVRQKAEIATILGLAPDRLRVLSYDVGGNFGTRNRVYVEFPLVVWAAGKVGRSVKYTATRSEAFLSDYQGRDLVTRIALAMRRDGRFLALRCDNISNVGARCVSLSPLSKGSGLITGSYDIPVASLRARAVFTNTTPTQAYRSSGRPEVNFAIERLIDLAAEQFSFDKIDLRRRNFVAVERMPYRNAVGMLYDSGTYAENLDSALRLADVHDAVRRRKDAKRRGMLHGIGIGHYVESSIGSPRERAEITVQADGVTTVVIGTQPSGQGHETSFAQVIADGLGLPFEQVRIVLGDTDIVSLGGGSHSGRSMRHAGTVMVLAMKTLVERARRIAAIYFEASLDTVEFTDGRLRVTGRNVSLNLIELAAVVPEMDLPADLAGPLAVSQDNEMHEPVFPNGCAICEVEIDPETGVAIITRYSTVDDVGRCINPLIVHGQTHGGIVQGLGQAMTEECHYDVASGQPLAGSFMDYGMPHARDVPSFRAEIVEVLSPTNPLGIKAGGEGGTTPALSAYSNAVCDALKDFGVEHIPLPITSFAIWNAIRNARK